MISRIVRGGALTTLCIERRFDKPARRLTGLGAMPGRPSTSKGDFTFVDIHVGARLRDRRE
jgi:hypothetical protein